MDSPIGNMGGIARAVKTLYGESGPIQSQLSVPCERSEFSLAT